MIFGRRCRNTPSVFMGKADKKSEIFPIFSAISRIDRLPLIAVQYICNMR